MFCVIKERTIVFVLMLDIRVVDKETNMTVLFWVRKKKFLLYASSILSENNLDMLVLS